MENYINSLFSINHALQNGFKSILDKYKVSNSSLWGYSHFFPPIAPPFKNRWHRKAVCPLRRPEGWPPYTLPPKRPYINQNRAAAVKMAAARFYDCIGLEFLWFFLCKERTPAPYFALASCIALMRLRQRRGAKRASIG